MFLESGLMYCKCCTQVIQYTIHWRKKHEKTIAMSIRVSEEELEKLKKAAKIESYASYSEFIRRTALKEANKIIQNEENIK